jgi:DNA-directed RNA polymerase subunit M/transcription elongation factor TFIIS
MGHGVAAGESAVASGPAYPTIWQELPMSEVYARPEPTLIPIPRPLCPACQSRMMLIHARASCDGPHLRIFECSKCGNVHRISMGDPMRSAK